jgi:hypothetical protein
MSKVVDRDQNPLRIGQVPAEKRALDSILLANAAIGLSGTLIAQPQTTPASYYDSSAGEALYGRGEGDDEGSQLDHICGANRECHR